MDKFTFYSKDYPNAQVHLTTKLLLYADELDEIYPDSGCFIFVSQHRSASNIPTLTCHTTGNFDGNLYGGRSREMGICYPWIQKQYLVELDSMKTHVPQYDIIIEASHHGPTSLSKPTLFIEIGSTEKQWADKTAAQTVCMALLRVVSTKPDYCKRVAIALGGTHYPTKFNKLLLETEYGLGSVVAKHNLQYLDELMVKQMISRSVEDVSFVVIDAKGMGGEKHRLLQIIEKTELELIKV
ncbi:MAG: D-aminoacyl-tRNA deacylase [Thermoproteota archaeon]|nr:D-aminoacyl-tRNA deacylase [Thermoproteota archaeon]